MTVGDGIAVAAMWASATALMWAPNPHWTYTVVWVFALAITFSIGSKSWPNK